MRRQYRLARDATFAFYPPEERQPDGDVEASAFVSASAPLSGVWPATLTADALDEALTAAPERGSYTIQLGDASGVVVGERYLLRTDEGDHIPVQALGKNSAGQVRLADPIPRAMLITGDGCSLLGWRHELALTATQLGTRRRDVRVELSYQVDGREVEHVEYFDVVLLPFNVRLTEPYVEQFWPAFGEHSKAADWKRLAEGVIFETIFNELLGADIEPDKVRNPAALRPWAAALVIEATIANRLAVRAEGLSEALLNYWGGRAQAARSNIFGSKHLWYDANDDLAGSSGRASTFADDVAGDEWERVDADDSPWESVEHGLPVELVPVS
jgi:hypothetical protein